MGSGLFALGTRAMYANTAVLDTISNNISNANTEGYSRQQVELATEDGRFTGAGFFGRGVRIATVSRTSDPYLAREANNTASVASAYPPRDHRRASCRHQQQPVARVHRSLRAPGVALGRCACLR